MNSTNSTPERRTPGSTPGVRSLRLTAGRAVSSRPVRALKKHRGVASVLAMMFIIMFGSLAAAMAIVSKGNTVTAATHVRVLRAQGAAETGLRVAQARLMESAQRFLVAQSNVDSTYGTKLWTGNTSGYDVTVLPPKTAPRSAGSGNPTGIAQALADLHSADQDLVSEVGITAVTIANAMAGASPSEYASSTWVYTPAVAIEPRTVGSAIPPVCFQVTYAPLANGTDVRVIATGYDFSYQRHGAPVRRSIMQDFRITKRVNQAIVSPTRVMIGKNVNIAGDLGMQYTTTNVTNGNPVIVRSDFYHLNSVLDRKLEDFFLALKTSDVDEDNRLRKGHPTEGGAIPSGSNDYDSDGSADNAFADVTGDGYVDDFDIFIKHYDQNADGKLVLSSALTSGTPAAALSAEFTTDDALAVLIDSAIPDRNKNGIYGYVDVNGNGYWDSGDGNMADFDAANAVNSDQILGYRDGVIDKKDLYAKVRGTLSFRATQAQWSTDQGAFTDKIRGAIATDPGVTPVRFGVPAEDMPTFDIATLASQRTDLQSAADGQSFDSQVASQLGISTAALATYVESQPSTTTSPRHLRLDADVAPYDGIPDNSATAYFEKMPYNSPNFSDYYYRPVYQNFEFKDVQIPTGTNALFLNCTFVGVTWVRSGSDNTHVLWNEYGKMVMDSGTGRPKPAVTRTPYGDDAGENSYPASVTDTGAGGVNHVLLMGNPPLDKADLPANVAAITTNFDQLPAPLLVGTKRYHDTKGLSNNIRFHDCTFVGSLVSDTPTGYTHVRNKMQFTGATRFTTKHPTFPTDSTHNPEAIDATVIAKSSLMLPNYSVDLGTFNSPASQNLQLKGTIIAGVMDIRGNCSIDGALLLTFSPQSGQGPLRDALGNPIGNPAGFNTTLGYFGPDEGDEESLDPDTLPVVSGTKIVGWDTNGDGLADVAATQAQPPGSTAVPFNGFGRVQIRFNPNLTLPDGIKMPLQFQALTTSYREGKL